MADRVEVKNTEHVLEATNGHSRLLHEIDQDGESSEGSILNAQNLKPRVGIEFQLRCDTSPSLLITELLNDDFDQMLILAEQPPVSSEPERHCAPQAKLEDSQTCFRESKIGNIRPASPYGSLQTFLASQNSSDLDSAAVSSINHIISRVETLEASIRSVESQIETRALARAAEIQHALIAENRRLRCDLKEAVYLAWCFQKELRPPPNDPHAPTHPAAHHIPSSAQGCPSSPAQGFPSSPAAAEWARKQDPSRSSADSEMSPAPERLSALRPAQTQKPHPPQQHEPVAATEASNPWSHPAPQKYSPADGTPGPGPAARAVARARVDSEALLRHVRGLEETKAALEARVRRLEAHLLAAGRTTHDSPLCGKWPPDRPSPPSPPPPAVESLPFVAAGRAGGPIRTTLRLQDIVGQAGAKAAQVAPPGSK